MRVQITHTHTHIHTHTHTHRADTGIGGHVGVLHHTHHTHRTHTHTHTLSLSLSHTHTHTRTHRADTSISGYKGGIHHLCPRPLRKQCILFVFLLLFAISVLLKRNHAPRGTVVCAPNRQHLHPHARSLAAQFSTRSYPMVYLWLLFHLWYANIRCGVATISRLLNITGLFCKRAL